VTKKTALDHQALKAACKVGRKHSEAAYLLLEALLLFFALAQELQFALRCNFAFYTPLQACTLLKQTLLNPRFDIIRLDGSFKRSLHLHPVEPNVHGMACLAPISLQKLLLAFTAHVRICASHSEPSQLPSVV
jgi:hypothetical protein